MKKINLLFAMLISMLMMFAACSSTSDSLDEEDEDSPADVVKGSSSSKKGNSSSESITPFDSTMDVNTKLASPSDLKAIARSDTSWELQWSYIRNDGFAEEGFYILQLDIEKSQWLEVGKASAEVTHYNIKGADMSGHYYRVCAYNKAGRSAYTGEFYIEAVAAETPDATSFILASPTELTASMQTDTTWTLSWKYSRAENAPESGFKIEQLDMAKSTWNEIGKSGAEVTHFVLVGKSKAGFYYRVCAYDKKGNSRYTEDLFVTKPESEAPVSNKIASPANLSVKMLSDNTWELSWEYEPTADHPEAGFYIDQLVPSKEKGKSSDWKNIGISSKEVYHFLLEGEDFAGHYYRVCAFNKDDGNSSYAKEIYIDIPKAEEVQSASLASPTNLKLSIISEGVWELTWDYSPAKRAPEDGFIIQKLQKGEWTDLGKSNKEVYHYQLGIDDKELYYRVCAYNLVGEGDTKTTERSSHTNEVYFTAPKAEDVQNAVIASPSGLTIKSINPSSWELAWNYTASEGVPEKGFIVEQLDMTKNVWVALEKKAGAGVYHYLLDGDTYGKHYYHVAAYTVDGKDTVKSRYTADVYASVASETTGPVLANPSALTVKNTGTNAWELSWSYTATKGAEEDGFVIEMLDMSASTPTYKTVGTTATGVKHFNLKGSTAGDHYYRVAAVAGTVKSSYTADVWVGIQTEEEVTGPVLAAPSGMTYKFKGLNADKSGYGELSWNYTRSAKAESGFVIQKLDLKNSKWVDVGTSGAGVNHYTLEKITEENYYRVCAYAKTSTESDTSKASNEVLVTKPDVPVLSVPTTFAAEFVSDGVWELTWKYSSNKDLPETGFAVQILLNGEWKDVSADVKAGVYHYTLKNSEISASMAAAGLTTYADSYLRVVALNGTEQSEPSNEKQIAGKDPETVELAVPKDFKVVRLAPSIWQLEWTYTDEKERPAEGFVLQKLDNATNKWDETNQIPVGVDSRVHIYKLTNGNTTNPILADANDYFRITSYDNREVSPIWSDKALVGTKVDYREDLVMTVPTVVPSVNDRDLEFLITQDFPNKAVEYSEWTKKLEYEYRWVDGVNGDISTVVIDVTKTMFKVTPDNVCNAYMQIRVKWTDTNGYVDYSEWSSPIGSKPGSDAALVDKEQKCAVKAATP